MYGFSPYPRIDVIRRIKCPPVCQECGEEITTDFCYATDRSDPRETAICQACAHRIMTTCRSVSTYVADLLDDYFREWSIETELATDETDVIYDPDNMRACR